MDFDGWGWDFREGVRGELAVSDGVRGGGCCV